MDKSDFIDKCVSQEDNLDDEIDLELIVKTYDDEIMSQEEDSSSKINDNDIVAYTEDSNINKIDTSIEPTQNNVDGSKMKKFKSNKGNNRKPNQRSRYYKNRSLLTSKKSNNADTVDRWQHDKFDMLYGDNNPVNMDVLPPLDKENESNVEEIKECIVSKLQSLTLTNYNTKKRFKNPHSNVTSKFMNNPNVTKSDRNINNNRNHKPIIPVVVSDNTKKPYDKRNSPLLFTQKNSSINGHSKITNLENITNTFPTGSTMNSPKSPSLSLTNVCSTGKQPNQSNETTDQTMARNHSIPYQPKFNPKKYFGSTQSKNNSKSHLSSNTHNGGNFNEISPSMDDHQIQQSYNDSSSYFMDQNYYYYQNPYYSDMSSLRYQPNIYVPTIYSPDMYYNENTHSSYAYYDQSMYSDGFYYQPMGGYYPYEPQRYTPNESYRSYNRFDPTNSNYRTRRY